MQSKGFTISSNIEITEALIKKEQEEMDQVKKLIAQKEDELLMERTRSQEELEMARQKFNEMSEESQKIMGFQIEELQNKLSKQLKVNKDFKNKTIWEEFGEIKEESEDDLDSSGPSHQDAKRQGHRDTKKSRSEEESLSSLLMIPEYATPKLRQEPSRKDPLVVVQHSENKASEMDMNFFEDQMKAVEQSELKTSRTNTVKFGLKLDEVRYHTSQDQSPESSINKVK